MKVNADLLQEKINNMQIEAACFSPLTKVVSVRELKSEIQKLIDTPTDEDAWRLGQALEELEKQIGHCYKYGQGCTESCPFHLDGAYGTVCTIQTMQEIIYNIN